MKVELTQPQIKKLRLSLLLAEEWEESIIDAYSYSYGIMDSKTVIPRSKRNIKSFRKLYDILGRSLKIV